MYCNRNCLEAVCLYEKTESAEIVQKTLFALIAVLALPILSAAAEETPTPDLAAYMRECPQFTGMDRYYCMAAILSIRDALPGAEGAQAKSLFTATAVKLLMGRAPEQDGANAPTHLFVGFDETPYRHAPRGTPWPARPPHTFIIACGDAGYQVSLFMHGVPVKEKDGGTIVQFKVDDTPTQTLFLNADSLNGFSGRLSGTGDSVDALIEAIRGGEEMDVWVSVPRKDIVRKALSNSGAVTATGRTGEARLAFSVAEAGEHLAAGEAGCGR